MITILGSIVDIAWGDSHDHIMSTKIFIVIVKKMFISTPKIYKENGCNIDLDLLINMCFMSL